MMNIKTTISLLFTLFFAYSATAQYEEQFKLIEKIGGENPIEVYEIFNGVKVYVKQNKNAPKVTARLVMKMGFADEGQEKKGVSEILRVLLNNGTANVGTYSFSQEKPIIDHENQLYLSRNRLNGTKSEQKFAEKYFEIVKRASFYAIPYELPRIMEELNMEQKSYVNKEEIVFEYNLAHTEMKSWFRIQNEMITNPAFRQYSLAAQKAKLALYHHNNETTLKNNLLESWLQPYDIARSTPNNNTTDMDSISAADVLDFYQKNLFSDNISIFLEGNIEGKDMAILAFSYFGHLNKNQKKYQRIIDISLIQDLENEIEGTKDEIIYAYKIPYKFQGEFLAMNVLKNWLQNQISEKIGANAICKVSYKDFEEADLFLIKFYNYSNTDWLVKVDTLMSHLKNGKIEIKSEDLLKFKNQTSQEFINKKNTTQGSFELFDIAFRNKMLVEELFMATKYIDSITNTKFSTIISEAFMPTKLILKVKQSEFPVAEMPIYEAYPIHLNFDKVSTFGNNVLNSISDPFKPNEPITYTKISAKNKIPFYHTNTTNNYAVLSLYFNGNYEGDLDMLSTHYANFINQPVSVASENKSNFTIVKIIGNNSDIKELSKLGSLLQLNMLKSANHKFMMMLLENNETNAEFEVWAKKLPLLEVIAENSNQNTITNNWVGLTNTSKMKTKDLPLFLLMNTYYFDGEYALFYNEINHVHGLSNQYKNVYQLPMNKSEMLMNSFYVRTLQTDSVSRIVNEIKDAEINELMFVKAKKIITKQLLENGISENPLLNALYYDYFNIKNISELIEDIYEIEPKNLEKYSHKYFKSAEIVK